MPQAPRKPTGLRRRLGRSVILYAILVVGAVWVVGTLLSHQAQPQRIRFDTFISKVDNGEVRTAKMFLRDQRVEGELTNGKKYQTTFAGDGDQLSQKLASKAVQVTPEPQGQSVLMSLLTNVL